jgi:phosphate transport system substrate-binding protein
MADPQVTAPSSLCPDLSRTTTRSLILGLLLIGFPASAADEIIVKGSDTMVALMKRWTQAWSATQPGVSVQVTGGGTGTGFAALVNRTTAICMASRPIRTDEMQAAIKSFRRRPNAYTVALDALVLYSHESNPVPDLTLDQLARLFTGQIRQWQDLGAPPGPVVLYSRENSSGTYEFFKEHVLQGRDFAPHTLTLPGTAAVVAAVARDRSGIGYGGAAFGAGTRPIPLRRTPHHPPVLPSAATVADASYPVWRPLYLYVNPALDHGSLAAFIGWILSPPGQAIVHDTGFFPVPHG